jgi:demethylmenaquinone methyltransferase / 2-methoxy-6-polyprenyl-1,4-benzoquinol methylase
MNASLLSKAPEAISGMFNRIAKTYDLLNDVMTLGMHRRWKQQACRALGLQPSDRVLDVCTGTGDLAAILSPQVSAVTGLDFSNQMLFQARMRFAHFSNITWQQGDALALPFEDNSFDSVMISFGLRNVHSVRGCIEEMVRVVKPGGRILNLDTASDNNNPLFWIYFNHLMPRLGGWIARDENAYAYLCQSTQAFASPSELQQYFELAGLRKVEMKRLGFGAVAMHVGEKPILAEALKEPV